MNRLIGLAPSNHGTTLDGLLTLATDLGLSPALAAACSACAEQEQGSAFLQNLNAGGDTVSGVRYTVIATRDDEVVTPYTSAFLAGANVTNITIQSQCPVDQSDHLAISYDSNAARDVLNALDPARPVSGPCNLVVPLVGG